jgi:hypothetical protein
MIDFGKKEFIKLAGIHKPHCISIFIPTHRAGQEVNEGKDRLMLKNQLQKAEKELKEYKLTGNEIKALLAPAREMLDDVKFWKYQSDGLALFIANDFFRSYSLPIHFEEYVYVADHYYLKPLVPLFNAGGEFFILALSQKDVRLYQGFPFQLNELEVKGLLPEELEKVVGYDYKQKYLQFREGQTGTDKTMFHGHGEGKDDKKDEITKFFRAVNRGVMDYLGNSKAPLIIAAVDYLIPIYLDVNEYKNVYSRHISGNPEEEDPLLLHEKAMELLHDRIEEEKRESIASFERELSFMRASYREGDIIPASINGRVDTLFIQNRSSLWGTYVEKTNSVDIDDAKTPNNVDLLNTAAIETKLKGGSVFLLEKDEMPEPRSLANALLRY